VENAPPKELHYKGRPVVVRGGDIELRPYRGFFYGDDWDAHPEHAASAGHFDVTIEYRGAVVGLHRTSSGRLHSHELPFVSFGSVDEAVEYIAARVDRNTGDGDPEKPEPA
jgi:hypothetical protein